MQQTVLPIQNLLSCRVVFVGKVSEGVEIQVAIAHQHKIGHLVPYLENHLSLNNDWPRHVPKKYHPT